MMPKLQREIAEAFFTAGKFSEALAEFQRLRPPVPRKPSNSGKIGHPLFADEELPTGRGGL